MLEETLLVQTSPQIPVPQVPIQSTQPPIPPGSPPAPPEGFVDQLLAFIYTSAHWLGGLIVQLLEHLVPLQGSEKLVDPIGYLTLLTIFLILTEVAKKITWLVVIVGWILIVVRIIMEAK